MTITTQTTTNPTNKDASSIAQINLNTSIAAGIVPGIIAPGIIAPGIYYKDKNTQITKSRHDTVRRDFRLIPRSNNPSKTLSRAAMVLLANYDDLLKKSKTDFITVRHEFISTITQVKRHQNCRLHKELSDIFDIQYHQSITIANKKHRDTFIIQRTATSEEILQNPALFYSKKITKNIQNITQSSLDGL